MLKLIVGVGGVAVYVVVLALLCCVLGAVAALTMQHYGVPKELADLIAYVVALAFGGSTAALSAIWAFNKLEG